MKPWPLAIVKCQHFFAMSRISSEMRKNWSVDNKRFMAKAQFFPLGNKGEPSEKLPYKIYAFHPSYCLVFYIHTCVSVCVCVYATFLLKCKYPQNMVIFFF